MSSIMMCRLAGRTRGINFQPRVVSALPNPLGGQLLDDFPPVGTLETEADRDSLMRLQMLAHRDRDAAAAQVADAPPVHVSAAGQQDIDARQKGVARHPPPLSDYRPDRLWG